MGILRRLFARRPFWRLFGRFGDEQKSLVTAAAESAERKLPGSPSPMAEVAAKPVTTAPDVSEQIVPKSTPAEPAPVPAAEAKKPGPIVSAEQRSREELDSLLSTLEMHGTPDVKEVSPTSVAPMPGMAASATEENPIENQKRRWLKLKLRETTVSARPDAAPATTVRQDTLAALERLQQAPAMASIARSFVQVTRHENVDLSEVVEVVEKDPAIASRVLRMANSAMVAPASRIGDLKTAVTLLGVQRVRLTAQALTTLQESRNLVEGMNWKHLWIHSFACALLSPEIPRRLHLPVPEYAYLAGLVHDLGKILLSSLQPAEYRKLLMEASVEGAPLIELEERQFGVTHEEAGALFARRNHFPTSVIAVVEFHSRPEMAKDDLSLAASVNVANFLAKLHGLGFSGSPLGENEESLEDAPGWHMLRDAMLAPPSAEEFHLQLRPFLTDLKHELHDWVSGKRAAE